MEASVNYKSVPISSLYCVDSELAEVAGSDTDTKPGEL